MFFSVHQCKKLQKAGTAMRPFFPKVICCNLAENKIQVWKSHRVMGTSPLYTAQSSGHWPRIFLARCRHLRWSPRLPWWCMWWCVLWLSPSCLTISWSLLASTRGRKSEALSVLRVLKPRRGRPFPLMETYHWRLAMARRLLLPPPVENGCSVEWWRDA